MLLCVTPSPAIDRTARVPRLAFGEMLRPVEVVALAGGKGVNCARAARHLGALVVCTGLAGGHAGRWLVEELEREGLSPRFVEVGPETRTTYVAVDDRGRSVMIYEPAAALGADDLARLESLLREELLPISDQVAICGSLPPGLAADAGARLVRVAREASVTVLVDTGGEALRSALSAGPDIVKISGEEALGAGYGVGGSPAAGTSASARALVAAGAALAVVTDGPRGAAAATATAAWSVEAPRIRATNAVGSGDAFNAGLLTALASGAGVEAALARGTAAGAANAEGLAAGKLDAARVDELEVGVRIRRLAGR